MPLPTPEIPDYLRVYTSDQDPSLYSAIDQASWRFIMRVAQRYFATHAHPIYVRGLSETGISIETIPLISDMDQKLAKFGWRAVAVTGFIPPAVFLELLSLSILPIACDMRKLENIEYTPSPDIVHEAAGHAPILADARYSSFLHKFGEIARHAIFSKEDLDLYDAILNLSEVKEDPSASAAEVYEAQQAVNDAYSSLSFVSEATQVSRLGWWSTEYGLIRIDDKYLIYGAGLLSSIGESFTCFADEVRKIPLTLDCINVHYDITKPQPQLFYIEDFAQLEDIIDQLAATMAFRLGGEHGLNRAYQARTVTTTVLDTGLSISGVVNEYSLLPGEDEEMAWIKFSGPVQLAYKGQQLPGHGGSYHNQGYSTPLGPVVGCSMPLSQMSEKMMSEKGWQVGRVVSLEFECGIRVEGHLQGIVRQDEHCLLMTFANCTVSRGEEILFDPSWGIFDLACGRKVDSVFGGAADRSAYMREVQGKVPQPRPQKRNLSDSHMELDQIYLRVRQFREAWLQNSATYDSSRLGNIVETLDQRYPQDWLLRIELVELFLTHQPQSPWVSHLKRSLEGIAHSSGKAKGLISRGLELLSAQAGLGPGLQG